MHLRVGSLRLPIYLLPLATSFAIMGAVMACGFENFLREIFWQNSVDVELETIGTAAHTLKALTGEYPRTLEDLCAKARAHDLEWRWRFYKWPEALQPEWPMQNPYYYEVRGDEVRIWAQRIGDAPVQPGEHAYYEWPFTWRTCVRKAREFFETGSFTVSSIDAVAAGIPPVALWVFLSRRKAKREAGSPRFRLVPALAIALFAGLAGMAILTLHFGLSHH